MRKTGKCLLIFGIIALVGAILFGVTVAAFGVTDGDYGISISGVPINNFIFGGFGMGNLISGNEGIHFRNNMTNYDFDFEKSKAYTMDFSAEGLKNISVGLMNCHADITCSDTDKVGLVYTTGSSKVDFSARMEDGKLTIEEKNAAWTFGFGNTLHSTLTLTLPREMYEEISLDLASGKIMTKELTSQKLDANVASGSMELDEAADTIELNIASGKIIMNNFNDNTSSRVDVHVASGSVDMTGYKAAKTKAEIASGSVTLNGISGDVDGQLASGKLILNYAVWNGDLDVELTSGKVDATLPAGSGVNVDFERMSGSMNIDLNGSSTKLSENSKTTLGGANVHNVKAETLSGSVSIHN